MITKFKLFEKLAQRESLLDTITDKEVSIFTEFNIKPTDLPNKFNLEFIYNNPKIQENLKELNYDKSDIEYSIDFETFLKNIEIKYFFITKDDIYKFIVYEDKTNGNWNDVKIYSIKKDVDMNKFYNELSNKTIEIETPKINYIYNTSTGGNNWNLQNSEGDNIFKKILNKEELKEIAKKYKIEII